MAKQLCKGIQLCKNFVSIISQNKALFEIFISKIDVNFPLVGEVCTKILYHPVYKFISEVWTHGSRGGCAVLQKSRIESDTN